MEGSGRFFLSVDLLFDYYFMCVPSTMYFGKPGSPSQWDPIALTSRGKRKYCEKEGYGLRWYQLYRIW